MYHRDKNMTTIAVHNKITRINMKIESDLLYSEINIYKQMS